MSAYIVTDKTITAICEGLRRYNIGIDNPHGKEYRREDYYDESYDISNGYFAWLNAMHEDDIKSPRTGKGFDACGQALVNMNYKSVNARYDENDEPHKFQPTYNMKSGTISGMTFREQYDEAQILGAIRCYEYQSCECKEYYDSGIPAALKRLTYRIAESLAEDKYGDNDGMGYYDIH